MLPFALYHHAHDAYISSLSPDLPSPSRRSHSKQKPSAPIQCRRRLFPLWVSHAAAGQCLGVLSSFCKYTNLYIIYTLIRKYFCSTISSIHLLLFASVGIWFGTPWLYWLPLVVVNKFCRRQFAEWMLPWWGAAMLRCWHTGLVGCWMLEWWGAEMLVY